MSGPLTLIIKGGIGLIINGIVFLCVLLLGYFGFFHRMDLSVYDRVLKTKLILAPLPLSPEILPVDLNDSAERNLGELIDNRKAFADLLFFLSAGRLVGGIDFLFPRTRDPEMDQMMANNAAGMKGLILAVAPLSMEETNYSGLPPEEEDLEIIRRKLWHPQIRNPEKSEIPEAVSFLISNRNLAAKATALGHITVKSDSDGVHRRVPLFYRWEDGYIPLLPLAVAAVNYKIDSPDIIIDIGKEVIIPHPDGHFIKIPIDRSGCAWIPYPAFWESGFKGDSMDEIVDAVNAGDKTLMYNKLEDYYDKMIIVADTTSVGKDFGISPFDPVYPLSGIHESILNAVSNTGFSVFAFYKSTPVPICAALLCTGFILVCVAFYRKNDVAFHSIYLVALCAHVAIIGFLWFALGMVPWFAAPFFAIIVSWFVVFGMRLLKARENRLLLTEAMSRYCPQSVVVKILAEHKTDLVPANKEVSVLFADINGFTNWSSDKEAETVHSFLTDYLDSMSGIIFECGGTIDKFMGDGILAFFGDPFEQPDHTERCVRAAIAMQKKAQDLAVKWKPRVNIDLKIRIGINTGHMIVGNLKTKVRTEYTVIGAAVNLGQRMESNAPVEGILVTAAVREKVKDKFDFAEKRDVTVKGYDETIEAYVVGLAPNNNLP